MPGIDRRRLVQTAAASALAAGGAAQAWAASGAAPAKLSDIDHIVILMKENRSFDHYFGAMRGVRGFDDSTAVTPGGTLFKQTDAMNPDGYVAPFRLNTLATSGQRTHDLSHAWSAQHAAWNGGAMDGWIGAHRAVDGERGPMTMGYMTREDIPYYYALADAFTLCDGYHCSVLGPTHPNRYYLMSATNDPEGRHGGPAIDNSGDAYSWETYPERLERSGVSWRVYHDLDDYDCNVLKHFTQYQNAPRSSALYENGLKDRPFYELLADLSRGNIPQVTWIVPPSDVSEHPDWLPAAGEDHTSRVLAALWSNPKLWARTAFILNYDENDGQFDHVAPPTPPAGTPGEFIGGLPVGLGFRVPCTVISPFSRGGYGLRRHLRSHLDLEADRSAVRGGDCEPEPVAAGDHGRFDQRLRLWRPAPFRPADLARNRAGAALGRAAGDVAARADRADQSDLAAPGARNATSPRPGRSRVTRAIAGESVQGSGEFRVADMSGG